MTTTVTIKWQQQQQYNDNNNNTMTTTVTIKWQQQQQYNESIPIKEINGCKLLEKPMVINNAAFASKFETFYYSTLQQWQISSYIVQKMLTRVAMVTKLILILTCKIILWN